MDSSKKIWNDDAIEAEIRSIVKGLGINRMPSVSEIKRYSNDHRLINAIAKYGGFRYWSSKIGLNMKSCDSLHGWIYEDMVQLKLESLGYFVERMRTRFPYDMLVNSFIKVDVKGSKKYIGVNGNFYTFNLEKPSATCDLFILCLIGSKDQIEKILIIPASVVQHNTQISIGEISSKYMKYVDRFDILDRYFEFFNSTIDY